MDGILGVVSALIALLPLALVVRKTSSVRDHSVILWYYFSIVSKVAFAFFLYFLLLQFGGDGFSLVDDRNYDKFGWMLAHAWRNFGHTPSMVELYVDSGYLYFTAFLYTVFGHSTIVPRLINCFLAACIIFPVYRITKRVWGENAARIAAIVSALLPNLTYWAGQHFKDIIIMWLTIAAIDKAMALQRGEAQRPTITVIGLGIQMLLLCILRVAFGVLFGIALTLYTAIGQIARKRFFQASILSLVTMVVVFVILVAGGIEKVSTKASHLDILSTTMSSSGERNDQGGFIERFRIHSVREFYKLPGAIVSTLIIPFPPLPSSLSFEHITQSIYVMSNFFWVCLIPFAGIGAFLIIRWKPFDSLLIFFLPLAFIVVISVIALGVLRYREQFIPFYCIWTAIGIQERHNWQLMILMTYLSVLSLGMAVYLFGKFVI